jgi:hypothetical protein
VQVYGQPAKRAETPELNFSRNLNLPGQVFAKKSDALGVAKGGILLGGAKYGAKNSSFSQASGQTKRIVRTTEKQQNKPKYERYKTPQRLDYK